MRSRIGLILCVFSLLAGCGGGDDGGAPPTPPPVVTPPPPPPPVIGAGGGTVTESTGASVIVPAGALGADTTIRIAMDSTGAPAMPAGLTAAGNMYVVTPHGGEFPTPIEVSIPAPAVTLLPTQKLMLGKAQPGGEWILLDDTVLADGKLKANVTSFSFFTAFVITYTLPLAQFAPLELTATLTCGGQDCNRTLGPVAAVYTVTGNGGQLPASCPGGELRHSEYDGRSFTPAEVKPLSGYSVSKTIPSAQLQYSFTGHLYCPTSTVIGGSPQTRYVRWVLPVSYPNISIVRVPAQLDVIEGLPARLDVLLSGGAVKYVTNPGADISYRPHLYDRALVDWQRSDDGGASWRVIAHSFQNEANPTPFGTGLEWRPWSVRHGFIATAMDQGALIRVHLCYTPPAPTAGPPCLTSSATLVNVLQQSGVPTFTSSPRSVLVRTGQTANLSAAASGLPAPTLQWQTRPANSSDAWTNVTLGTGATTTDYITAATALSDNGTQYRVLATNTLGSAASAVVTVSVSDLDVAPSITTQPASLSVASGSDVVFAVDARGTEALSYQWYRDGSALAGENSPILRLTGVSIMNSGSFTVTVSNAAGDADSNAANLNVYPGTPAAVAPTIVTQPASLTVNAGNTATFAVGVDGTGPFTFQWRRNGINIAGATSAVLIRPAVVADAAGEYSVVVGNAASAGVTSDPATLSVNANGATIAPDIITQPATLIVAPGGSGLLAVAATGSGPLSYQWLNDGVPLSGETGPVLVIDNASQASEGNFAVRVSNSVGDVQSSEAQVILLGAPLITSHPAGVSLFENSTTTFRVEASGSNVHYQWLRNGSPISSSDSDSHTTHSLTVADSGAVYSVIVYNGAGVAISGPAVLTVRVPVPPTVLQQPADANIEPGAQATLCMAFGGTPPFTVQMTRWNGSQWTPVGAAQTFGDNAAHCITTPALQSADNGAQFRFSATNAEGGLFESLTRTVTVSVTEPTVIDATTLVTRATSGALANNRSYWTSLSADGNLVAFVSEGTNLVPGFATTFGHGYVRNLQTGVTTAVNQTVAGTESSQGIRELRLAAGGRYAVFSSLASDLVADDTDTSQDAFVRDLQTGTTERVNVLPDGSPQPPRGNSTGEMHLDISADGRYVIFTSFYDLTAAGAEMPYMGLFIRDMQMNQTRLIAIGTGYNIQYAALSASGEYVAYSAPQLGPVRETIWLHDAEADTTRILYEMPPLNGTDWLGPGLSISAEGRYVAFAMRSALLLGSPVTQAVVVDRDGAPNNLELVSTGSAGSGIGAGDDTSDWPELSADGRYVVFSTDAANLRGFGGPTEFALMVRDRQTQTTSVASRRADGTPVRTILHADGGYGISADGTRVVFGATIFDMEGAGSIEQHLYAAPRP
jgi:hypothetical protein